MPHYKCVTCRTRLRAACLPDASDEDLCPQCGSLLEPVEDLAELIGFRPIASVDSPAAGLEAGSHEPIIQRIDDLAAHRAGRLARKLAGARSTGSFDDPAAAALAVSISHPDR